MVLETKDFISLGISAAAIRLSEFTLVWTNFRHQIRFYYVQTNPWSFALVNGDKTDILVR